MDDLYYFPPPLSPEAVEWKGTPIGRSNIITRTKGRTPKANKVVDRTEGLRNQLVKIALDRMKEMGDKEEVYNLDVIIHGVRVKAITNTKHLATFWKNNWYSPQEWLMVTGKDIPKEPQVIVYAFSGAKTDEAAYYSRKANTIAFFNTSYYGQLKSWVLGAVGRILAEEYGIHSIHGACVSKGGKGVLYIAPTGTGKSTASYGIMEFPDARFHSDDWVYVRYTFKTNDNRVLSPIRIKERDGREVKGYQVYKWLEERAHEEKEAEILSRTLNDTFVNIKVKDLDLSGGVTAYAYTSEKIFYLRSNIVENFPDSAYSLLHSDFENAPDVRKEYLDQNKEMLQSIIGHIFNLKNPKIVSYFKSINNNSLGTLIARMIAFDNCRSMLDITTVFDKERVFTNPMEPVRLTHTILLKREKGDDTVAESLPLEKFMERLMIGRTPHGTKEIAYNAYRAVDDKAELEWMGALEKEADGKGVPLYNLYNEKHNIPETLYEEFELFRIMHKVTLCYDINTVLRRDPQVKTTREAVQRTMKLLCRIIDEGPGELSLDLSNYSRFIGF